MLSALLGILLGVQAPPIPVRPRPSAAEAIAANRLEIAETAPGEYSGKGWDQLIADGANAHFFMIGEQHGTADIGRFGIAVHRELAKRGYSHAGYEVGPYSMDFAEGLIRSGKGRLASYLRQPGKSLVLPFLFFQEEVDLAEQIVAASPDRQDALWGLDQEFVASGPIAAELLHRLSTTPAEHAAAAALETKIKDSPMLVGERPWEDLAFLEAAYARNPEASRLVEALKLSNRIYAPFTGRGGTGYAGNLEREHYMKRNFAARFAAAEQRNGRPPKVFFKFGGNHGQKGFTGTNVPGLGNFLHEWGVPRGLALVNVMVDCAGGSAGNPITGKAGPCESYFGEDSVLANVAKPSKMTLVDLRPLRPQLRQLGGLDEQSRRIILSYDYYLAIKDVEPATLTVAAP